MANLVVIKKLTIRRVIKVVSHCKICNKEIVAYKIRKFCSRRCNWDSHKGTKHSLDTKNKIVLARYNQVIPVSDTLPEKVMALILTRNSIRFRSQWNVDYKMIVDFYLPDFNVMLFVDGDFWHCHCRFGFPDDKVIHHGKTVMDIRLKDFEQTEYLKNKGFKVLRFWECDLMDRESVVEQQLKEEVLYGRESQVVYVEPLVKIPLYAGNSGECSNTRDSKNFELQTTSRQPEQSESPQRLYVESLY
jgi:DNA mismatch endonuclease Vsr